MDLSIKNTEISELSHWPVKNTDINIGVSDTFNNFLTISYLENF